MAVVTVIAVEVVTIVKVEAVVEVESATERVLVFLPEALLFSSNF